MLATAPLRFRLAGPLALCSLLCACGGDQVLLSTSFEELSSEQPHRVTPFRYTGTSWSQVRWGEPVHPEHRAWASSPQGRTGGWSVNVIPGGNPASERSASVSAALLDPVLEVDGFAAVQVQMWVLSTSNPRAHTEHDCDSALNVYAQLDDDPWRHVQTICGAHPAERMDWDEVTVTLPVEGRGRLQLAFDYGLQASRTPNPSAVFLIDDLEITGLGELPAAPLRPVLPGPEVLPEVDDVGPRRPEAWPGVGEE